MSRVPQFQATAIETMVIHKSRENPSLTHDYTLSKDAKAAGFHLVVGGHHQLDVRSSKEAG